MGYSSPKKQLDLKEFLSTPAKKLPFNRQFGRARALAKAEAPKPSATPDAKPDDAAT